MRLWDLYRNLLTPTQREITDLYFNLDLTVSEIAEQKGISRQAVSDCLAGCKKQLGAYEQKLQFDRLLTSSSLQVSFMATDVAAWAQKFFSAHPELKEEEDGLTAIINNDYEREITEALNNRT